MRRFITEYGYLAVMTVCLVCCAVLLVSVTTDRPLVAVSPISSPYRIVIRSIAVLWTAVLPIRRAYR